MEVSWTLHALAAVRRDEVAVCAHRVGTWVRLNAGLDGFQKRKYLTLPD
jgi:hypothetical protein